MNGLLQQRRREIMLNFGAGLIVLALLPVTGVIAWRAIRDSNAAQGVISLPSRAVPLTPTAIFAVTDEENFLTSLTVMALTPQGAGGTVMVIPVGALVGGRPVGKPQRLADVYGSDGVEALQNAVEAMTNSQIEQITVNGVDGTAELLARVGTVNATFITDVTDTESEISDVIAEKGPVDLTPMEMSAVLAARDISSRAAKRLVDNGQGIGPLKNGVNLDFAAAIERLGLDVVKERYGNLFEMYERIAGEDPYKTPMRIYPATHYTMGGLWVDYELMTTIPGLYAAGEANFSDHGANRLGASALMQGLADGYFVLPSTISSGLVPLLGKTIPGTDHPAFKEAEQLAKDRYSGYLNTKGKRSPDWFHRELGKIIWNQCGMERTKEGLQQALSDLPALYNEFQTDLRVTGTGETTNQTLEKAGRVDDFFQLGMAMCEDALTREESCGAHFRSEYQTPEGEAQRDDENFCHVAAFEWTGDPMKPKRNVEELVFENAHLAVRSYK